MSKSYSLNGEWVLTYTTPGNSNGDWGRWIRGMVPGDVHLDLMNAGLIAEPLIGDNSRKNGWIEEKDWWYKRTFALPDGFLGDRVELVCEGLDLTADIWLNGQHVGSANNMFIPHRFAVDGVLHAGENEILVRLDVGLRAVGAAPTEKFARSWGREEPRRPWMRKAQQAFYWDTAPRLLTCGIWRDIRLESFSDVILRDVCITSTFTDLDADIQVQVEYEALHAVEGILEIQVLDEETEILERANFVTGEGTGQTTASLNLKHPKLWWPNGLGGQHLYPVRVRLMRPDGTVYGERILRHGIREIDVLQQPLNDEEKTFTVVVNGCRVFCKGGNWVPSDAIYARINREKERRLLEYARDANFNMLRVWGGGVYPDSHFYEICDELGIMVWQDFMYACAYYPDDEPAFCDVARAEAELIVRKFRNQACLAIWSGNNENYMMHARVDPGGVFYGLKIYSEILPEVLGRLDPKTFYIPSDPYPGPWPGQEKEGTQHIWSYVLGWHDITVKPNCDFSPEEMATIMQLWNIPELNHKFVSEFGIFCPSNRASILKFMGEHAPLIGSPVYQHHRNHFEADFILEMLRRYYKRRDSYSFEEFTIAGQAVQAEALKYIFEEFRSRMYVCSGTLFWEYNDTWGHVGYSPVDYYLNVKPLYFYMRRAFAPLHAIFREQGRDVWLLNDTAKHRTLQVEYGCQTFRGEKWIERKATIQIRPSSSVMIGSLQADLPAEEDVKSAFAYVKVYDESGSLLERNRSFLVPIQDVCIPEDSMSTQITPLDASSWRVDVSAREFTWMVKIDADENLTCDDNAFDLWPGEHRSITVSTQEAHPFLDLRVENINQYINR